MNSDTRPARRKPGDEKILACWAMEAPKAAEEAVLSTKTIQRRMQDPLFRAEVGELKRLRAEQDRATIGRVETLAVVEFERLLHHDNPWIRRHAVKIALEAGARYRETDVAERLAAQEELARERAGVL